MRWFLKDKHGNLLGVIEEHQPDGCLGWIVLGIIILFLGAAIIASLITFPAFVLCYLKKIITYLVLCGGILLNTYLFNKDIPAMILTVIESVILGIVLILHNIYSSQSPYEGYEKLCQSNYFVEVAAVWLAVIIQSILAGFLMCFVCSLISSLIVKHIDKKHS